MNRIQIKKISKENKIVILFVRKLKNKFKKHAVINVIFSLQFKENNFRFLLSNLKFYKTSFFKIICEGNFRSYSYFSQ